MWSAVFRTDASAMIGIGHVVRCLTLANSLRERGAKVSFVCREHSGHLCELIEAQDFSVSRLPAPSRVTLAEGSLGHAAWLEGWLEDSEQTRTAVVALGEKPDWLVVDHYGLDQRWENAMRASVGRIMAIDDLADREHDCDLLLDQNLVARMYERYVGKVPTTCGLLLGPEYALLQPAYAELHDQIPPRKGPIRRILIFFSGADRDNWTGRTLSNFLQLNRPNIEVDVVIGTGGPHAESIRRQVAGHENIHLHSDLPTLAALMAAADLAIGAGGATSWERLCLGLPTLVITLADNQRPIAAELEKQSLIHWLGHHDVVSAAAVGKAIDEQIERGSDEEWSLRCFAAVDGRGVSRVCTALIVKADAPLQARNARVEDEALLLTWANDPITRSNAFSSEPIPAATHRSWFHSRLGNPEGCRLYIVETSDCVALGQVRFERREQAWEVDYALAPAFRSRRLGRSLLETALQQLRLDLPGVLIFGRVKVGNRSSRRVFESLGFETRREDRSGAVEYCRAL